MSTPIDSTSNIDPIKTMTEYTDMNGTAMWIKDRLIIVGRKGSETLLTAYKQEANGDLVIENSSLANETVNEALFNLSDLGTKMINTWPDRNPTHEMYSYNTYSRPIYLSPVTNLKNPDSKEFSLLAWNAPNTFNQLKLDTTNKFLPVMIDYSQENGFKIGESMHVVIPENVQLPVDPESLDGTTFNNAFAMALRVLAISPIIDEKGDLFFYFHTFNRVSSSRKYYMLIPQLKIENGNMVVQQFTPSVYPIYNLRYDTTSGIRDPMNYLPYGIFGKGDAKNETESSNTVNLFFCVAQDLAFSSVGVGTNLVIHPNGELELPPEQQIEFFEFYGIIFGNFFMIEQMYYPPDRDLNKGIEIGIRYRGVGTNNYVTRLGTLNVRKPWNPATWSKETALYGSTIVDGYGAMKASASNFQLSTPNIYGVDMMATVWDGIYSAVGIYEGQKRLSNPQTGAIPTFPEVGDGAKVLTKDLNVNRTSVYNTEIPRNIVLEDSIDLSPTSIGQDGLIELISKYSKDYPDSFGQLEFSVFDIDENKALNVEGKLFNPYINGIQLNNNLSIPINLKIQHPPKNEAIANPIIINSNSTKIQVPGSSLIPINEAFTTQGTINSVDGLIGLSNKDFIQIESSMMPFITNLKATADDFLGTMKIEYDVRPVSGNSYSGTIEITGFWGYVYIIPIVLGGIIIVAITIITSLVLVRKKHKRELKSSIYRGFNLYELNTNKPSFAKNNNNTSNWPPSNGPPPSRNMPMKNGPNSPMTNNVESGRNNISNQPNKPSGPPKIPGMRR